MRQLVNAEAYSASINRPLTVHITLHLRLADGFTPDQWARWQSQLMDKASRWLARQGVPAHWVWVRECGASKGEHLHWLVHLPLPLWGRFHAFLLYSGGFRLSGAGSEPIRFEGGRFGMYVPTMRAGVLRYLLKSLVSPRYRAALGIGHEATEPLFVQRCGASHSLTQKARAAAGWRELTRLGQLRAHLHPAREAAHVQ